MNHRKMNLGKLYNIFSLLLLLFSMLLLKEVKLGGVSLYLFFALLFVISLFIINVRKLAGMDSWLKWRAKEDWLLLVLFAYTLLRFISTLFTLEMAGKINLEFTILLFLSCLIYWIAFGKRSIGPLWLDTLTFMGGLGSLGILLYFLGLESLAGWISLVEKGTGTIASYLMLPGIFSVSVYCFSEEKAKRIAALVVAGIVFFTLILNQNQASLWLMVLLLLAIPCIYRPRAEWIKRDMQLLFLFAFLWCNMSLLVNYTEWIKKPLSFSLEASVYGELILALGGVIFFHFWDQIPEGKDLHKISMVRLQKHFRKLFLFVILILTAMLLNVNALNGLPDKGFSGFCKEVFLPLAEELQQTRGSFFITLKELGVVMSLLILLGMIILGKRIYKNIHMDKGITNMLFILYGIFVAEFILWDIAANTVLVYGILLALGSSIREEVVTIKSEKLDIRKMGGTKEQ